MIRAVQRVLWFTQQSGFWLSLMVTIMILGSFQIKFGVGWGTEQLLGLFLMSLGLWGAINILCWVLIQGWPQLGRDRTGFETWEEVQPKPQPFKPETPGEFLERTLLKRWFEIQNEERESTKRGD